MCAVSAPLPQVATSPSDPGRWRPSGDELTDMPKMMFVAEESSCCLRLCLNMIGGLNLRCVPSLHQVEVDGDRLWGLAGMFCDVLPTNPSARPPPPRASLSRARGGERGGGWGPARKRRMLACSGGRLSGAAVIRRRAHSTPHTLLPHNTPLGIA